MSMFENKDYRWRETCFVLFDSAKRPTLKKVQGVIAGLNSEYEIKNPIADEKGQFEALSVISPEDFAALDVCYIEGEEVLEQSAELVDEIAPSCAGCKPAVSMETLKKYEGRLDVLHFEYAGGEEGEEAMLDPSALLLVLAALAKLTDGVAVDPQSGTILSEDSEDCCQ